MSYVRLRPHEYQTLSHLCQSLDLTRYALPTFKRLLRAALADGFPELAGRLAGLGTQQVQVVYAHLRQRPPVKQGHGLTADEVAIIADVGFPLMAHARFAHLLKRALCRRLAECRPGLATKLERLSLRQFEGLCQEVNQRAEGKD